MKLPYAVVVFKEGVAYAKMAGQKVPFDALGEITDYKFSLGSNNNTGGDSEKPDTEKPETDNKPTEPDAKPEEKPKA